MKGRKVAIILIAFIVVFILISPLASSAPDGLENAMEAFGVSEHAIYHAPLSYGESFISFLVSAAIGIAITFLITYTAAKLMRKRSV